MPKVHFSTGSERVLLAIHIQTWYSRRLCILVVQIPSAEMEERTVAMTRPYNCKNLTRGSSIINYAQLSSVFKLIKCWLYTYIYIYTSENHTILLSVDILNRDGVFFNTFSSVPFNANYYNHLNTICYITKLAYQKTYCNIELAFHGNFWIMKTSYRYQFAAVRLFIYFLFLNLLMYIL